ncbi:MAG: UDP-N-acetylmuramoyl-L-alanyl-D-glutamate--2,6-diaminopimelate ligase [Solirubrobacterales bacterium]|nr:UDP-N-acetylmuramoyl-L-alanyl-D-glutamate--2,6-diaminopimelate ligase [Solirubrobacterales bacterium]
MRLGDILLEAQGPEAALEVSHLAFDDRVVTSDTLFFCVPGFRQDGHDFAQLVVDRGAVALVVERPLGLGVPEVLVSNVRQAMGPAASRFHGNPSGDLRVLGVTGTNGKTTSAYLVRTILEQAGISCGLLGTVESVVGGEVLEAGRTTPEAIDLQALLAHMRDGGDKAAAIEVSSHALDLGRVDGVEFAASIFTNLTQDHLDYHGTMAQYWESKRRLFTELPRGIPVINVDDVYGKELASELDDAVTFGISGGADWSVIGLDTDIRGSRFVLVGPDGEAAVETALPGTFNVSNVLGAAAGAHALGVGFEQIVEALPHATRVPGRFEPVVYGQPFAVLVDYAHTPDSLENVLLAARQIASGRVLCVFGCGGDRDAGKRPQMGMIAGRDADVAIVTSDNPRSEHPATIAKAVAAGAEKSCEIVLDRREAIETAIGLAAAGDVVVIAGKGHEVGQEFEQGRKLPFDDRVVAADALRELGWA